MINLKTMSVFWTWKFSRNARTTLKYDTSLTTQHEVLQSHVTSLWTIEIYDIEVGVCNYGYVPLSHLGDIVIRIATTSTCVPYSAQATECKDSFYLLIFYIFIFIYLSFYSLNVDLIIFIHFILGLQFFSDINLDILTNIPWSRNSCSGFDAGGINPSFSHW